MKLWLIMFLTNWLRGFKARNQPVEPEVSVEEEIGKCPICGEDWEEKAIFCCICGYELKDEELPLHPPPVRTEALTDPDHFLPDSETGRLNEKYTSIAKNKGWDIAVLILPEFFKNAKAPREGVYIDDDFGGIMWCLYNTWRVGRFTDKKGILFALDPRTTDRFLVTGFNGPDIPGSVFRKWYDELRLSDRTSPETGIDSAVAELEYIAEKIGEMHG